MAIGWKGFILVQLPVIFVSGAAGIWLFYVQHQFEGMYWERTESWSYFEQAIRGSSYYDLPKVLQWFTGNIGFHHVHHLEPRVPNYFLERCHSEVELFREVRPISLVASGKFLGFRLWDERERRLVGFGHAEKLSRQVLG
jgi:omega-6 fatty acid desaturase (delta-12 desaturase)